MAIENVEDVYALSPLQQGILFHTLYEQGSGLYFEQSVSTLRCRLEARVLRRGWQRVLDRHPALRSSFHWEGLTSPVQVVHRQVALPFHEEDWRAFDGARQGLLLESFLNADRERGFDLAEAPLLRVALLRTAEDSCELVLSFQHLLMDRWSRFLILREALASSVSLSEGREPPWEPAPSYGSYIAWLRAQDPGAAEAFWRRALRGFEKPTVFDLGSPPGDLSRGDSVEEKVSLSEEATARLAAFGRAHGLTMNTLVQGAWSILASRYTGETDVVTGAVVSGRPPELSGVESIVGLFINTLPVRVTVRPGEALLGWLRGLQQRVLEMRQYEYSALLDIQQWSEIPRGQPLFESLLVFENVGLSGSGVGEESSVQVLRTRSVGSRTNYPLTVLALPGRKLVFRATSESGRFPRAAISRILGHLRQLLEAMPEDAGRTLGNVPMLSGSERHRLLVEWNRAQAASGASGETLYGLWKGQVARTPEACALEGGGELLTYAQLDARSDQLARRLRREGVRPEVPVGITLRRSIDMIVALLGVQDAGGVYVPIDPDLPSDRIEFLVRDARIRLVLTDRASVGVLPGQGVARIVLDAERDRIAGEDRPAGAPLAQDDQLVYILYTSGSTGVPKGVAMPHRPLVNLIGWQLQNWTPPAAARTLQFAPLSFDVSFQEIFSTLCSGGTLVLIPEQVRRDPAALSRFLAEKRIERAFLPFVALRQLAELWEIENEGPGDLREVITAGEQLQITPQIAAALSRRPGCVLHNQYGPTETHVVTASRCTGPPESWPAFPSIGRPIPNARIYVLDSEAQPVPVGVPGEIWVGGIPIARGYVDRSELTAATFVPDPFVGSGARAYRTGDIARFREDGFLDFLGRRDLQVKIRGYRVEPGEVEAALLRHPGVRASVVHARDEQGHQTLVAYLITEGETRPSVVELRASLKKTLPDYMVPSAFVFLDAFPLTPSGKVDRRRLPAPDGTRPEGMRFVPARSPVEKALAEIWKGILRIDRVGLSDNFFELGGHSLLATQVVSRVAESLGLRMPLRRVFEEPTLEGLALSIVQDLAESEKGDELLRMLAEVRGLSDEEARSRLVSEAPSEDKGAAPRPS